ncbi:MAG: acyl-CoA thioesterase [Bacteroidales bacterium]|nr:acyl-CoA thioesterase [Bacteroidales bacterium]
MRIFSSTDPVRYYETDQMGVVHHSNYIRFFENARSQMMADLGCPIEQFEKQFGILIPIVSVSIRYRHPARMGDVLTATAAVPAAPMAKMTVVQTVVNQRGELCAEGEVVLGFIDSKTFRATRCPEVIAKMFEEISKA